MEREPLVLPGHQEEPLWKRAERAGIARREFLVLLGMGGAAAVLAACTRATPSPTPAPSPAATATPEPPHVKPLPGESFIAYGLNQETRLEAIPGYIFPASRFFVRNHHPTPRLDARTWRLKVEGDGVGTPLELNYDDLVGLPATSVVRYIECSGNGRSFFRDFVGRAAEGTPWRLGAYGIAEWTGVALWEVLERAGIKGIPRGALNILLEGLDAGKISRPIPVEKARQPDTILAYAMNGEPLAPDHGFPVRALVPGWGGIASVKWLGRVEVRNSDKDIAVANTTRSYIWDSPDPYPQAELLNFAMAPDPSLPPLREQTLKGSVALPWGGTLPAGSRALHGFAWSPFGAIARVEVSLDDGPWEAARLLEPNIGRAGVRWEFPWKGDEGDHTIQVRASDERGKSQPDAFPWNRLGFYYNAVVPHPIKVVR